MTNYIECSYSVETVQPPEARSLLETNQFGEFSIVYYFYVSSEKKDQVSVLIEIRQLPSSCLPSSLYFVSSLEPPDKFQSNFVQCFLG